MCVYIFCRDPLLRRRPFFPLAKFDSQLSLAGQKEMSASLIYLVDGQRAEQGDSGVVLVIVAQVVCVQLLVPGQSQSTDFPVAVL